MLVTKSVMKAVSILMKMREREIYEKNKTKNNKQTAAWVLSRDLKKIDT